MKGLPPPSFFLDKRLVVVVEELVPHRPLGGFGFRPLCIDCEDAVLALDGDDGGRVFDAALREPIQDLVSDLWCFS